MNTQWIVCLTFVVACGSAGSADEEPILDRPSLDTYACAIERPRTDHSPLYWGYGGHAMITTTGGTALFARFESMAVDPFNPSPSHFVVSAITRAGTFGASVEIASSDMGTSPVLARRGDGAALLWIDGNALRFAGLDATGQTAIAPKTIAGVTLDTFSRPAIAASASGGFGVVYGLEGTQPKRELWFVALDASGAAVGAPRRLAVTTDDYVDPAPVIVPAGAGFAVAWRDRQETRGQIYFAQLDAAGAETSAAHVISVTDEDDVDAAGATGFDRATIALLEIAGGFIAAWPEIHEDAESGAFSLIRLAKLDASGQPQGTPVALRAGVEEVDEVEPTLVRYADDAVGVLWSSGSHIYTCGGCVPDHRIDFVLLDPVSLSRLSDVLSVNNGGGRSAGGLLRRDVAVMGDGILTTFDQTFHTSSKPSSATFACTPR